MCFVAYVTKFNVAVTFVINAAARNGAFYNFW